MKCSVLCLGTPAALLLTSFANGQTFGATERLTNTVLDPRDVLSGDLDGDGDLEPIALSGLDGQISYWDNRGGGNFGPQISLPSVEPGVDVGASGDVDGNGTVDLIVGTDAGVVVVHLNDGSGGWTRIQITQIASVVELACEDLNVDGIDDVVLLADTGAIEWFAGAQGSTPLAQGLIGQSALAWLEILDLDGDSDPDVMLSNDADLLHYMENDGAGAFTASSELIWSGGALRRGHLVDIDSDGMPDVVRHLGSQITWNNGLPGGFNESLAVLQQVPFQDVLRVSPDLDGDGKPELWVASGLLGSAVEVIPITGSAPPPYLTPDPTFPFESDAYWDFGGYADLFGTPAAEFGRRSHLMVIDDPVNGGSRTLADWSGSNDATCVLDFNRDGRRDVLAAGPIFGEFSLFLNLGGGAFARRRVVGQSIDPTRLGVAPVPIDADQDGDLDLAFGYSNTQFAWYEMGPSGIESLNVVGFPGNGGEARLTPLDLDGDGDLDLLHEEFYRSSNGFVDFREVSWFQSFGVTFGPRQSLGLGGFIGQQSSSVDLADIDADGINDLVILRANSGPAGITWFAGVGNGGYVNQGNIGGLLGNPRASAFKVCDIDGDGLNDIVTSGRDGLAWYRNFGNLLFGPQQLLIPTETEQLDVRDFDADGDIDIIVGGNWVGGIAIALANLGGVFGAPQPINGLISAEGSVQLEDVDGDGDLDALFTTNYDVWWSENLTPPLTGIGSIYCSPGVNNSTGLPGRMRADGSATVADQDVTISALDLPTSSFGFFITSRQAGFAFPVSNSEGALCVTGSIGRYVGPGQIQNSGTAGEFSLALDLNAVPSPTGFLSVAPGDTWHFQAWYRDAIGGQTTSNFTDAVAVTFQ